MALDEQDVQLRLPIDESGAPLGIVALAAGDRPAPSRG
jgi:hypothetical protein